MGALAKTAKRRLNDTILEMAAALHNIKAIDMVTMREFESLKLREVEDLTAKQIKSIRLREKVSQSVFAKFLNTTVHTIRDWEQGKKRPRGTSLKLLNLIVQNGLVYIA